MPKVVDAARVTTPPSAVWRSCTTCDHLVPLAPDTARCPRCQHLSATGPAFTERELAEARADLAEACAHCRTRLDRIDAVNAFLTGYLGTVVTAVLGGRNDGGASLRRAAALYAVRKQVIA
ncbi:hypothetical protein EV385_2603 [Krasilnikovia cinnamomea]|uniref:Uncharacterized protein n=1 Tax=Krasilnikovia cinnamomea TaxID=349313 RepID=A0A4Q7ZIY2_9ACTN|nr:hypothetical protein [Krasilnikovia cinnamomea]RZU50817.1 hypothetical protein EV385_2603 [Krasilnikovia cinnamomea]